MKTNFDEILRNQQVEIEKSFEELESVKERFWTGHNERMNELHKLQEEMLESVNSLSIDTCDTVKDESDDSDFDEILKIQDEISNDLDELLSRL